MRLFHIHDSRFFFERLGPALGQSFRSRSFDPIVPLIAQIDSRLAAFAARYRLTDDERPLVLGCRERSFSRSLWRHYAGELMLYAAAESPVIRTEPELLSQFLPAGLVERIHRGSEDVQLGGIAYRPGMAGLHAESALAALTIELATIDPCVWTADASAGADDSAEELAFGRQCFGELRSMIESAHALGRIIVCEEI
jgi:hypothetical protein